MDLDDFGNSSDSTSVSLQSDDVAAAVRYIDSAWYGALSRKARWMDLVGDFAGNEPFVIHGDSLLQYALSDDMLALGGEDLSMQLLHAKYVVERLLSDFLKRSDNFDVVFWHENRFITLTEGESPFEYSSRCLARQALLHHLKTQIDGLKVHQFQSIVDPEWLGYLRTRRPMYVMLHDGGVLASDSSSSADSLLLQRAALLNLMTQGLACTLLHGVEFRDSKILSFVLDQRVELRFHSRLGRRFWSAVSNAKKRLESTDLAIRGKFSSATFADFKPNEVGEAADQDYPMIRVVRDVLAYTGDKSLSRTLLYLFVAHMFLLPTLAVTERARGYRRLHPDLEVYLRSTFLPATFFALDRCHSDSELDIDGRIFLELVAFVSEKPPSRLSDVIGSTISDAVDRIWMCCCSAAIDFQVLSVRFPLPNSEPLQIASVDLNVSVMPFESPLFQEAISSVQAVVLNQDQEAESQSEGLHVLFSDTRHWHNESTILPKHLGGEDRVVLTGWQRERKLRSEQRFVAKMQWQAESLTGALGRPLQRITIVSSSSAPKKAIKPPPSQVLKPPKKGKKEHVSKADLIRQQHAAKKRAETDNSNGRWWVDQLSALAPLPVSEQLAQLDRLANNRRFEEGWLAVEARLYRLHLLFFDWIGHPEVHADSEKVGQVRDEFTVRIMRVVKDVFERGYLFPNALAVLDTVLRAIGLACYHDSLLASSPNSTNEDRKLSFKFVKLLRSKGKSPAHKFMPIVEHPVEWQLRLFGEYMDRSMDSADDPRVSFKPDAWQRQVLDCLDQEGHSVLVVAPTSAGKTFISYYAMEQVLRSSDDDILVYIAPTKALVSQIAAEIYARFQKSFVSSGKSMWAIHTRDYRVNNPQNCQILVTVPEMFAIMLLSPPLARVWTPRIKRIILDEIHTIGQQEGGAVWEQIILLAPCPIIGLSATIGEPERFNDWLRSVQEAHGFRHTFINWPYRYSHLRKYEYALYDKADKTFSGLDKHVPSSRMRFLHPVSLLSFGPRSLPPDFSLEASDCLSLFRAFTEAQNILQIDVNKLSPLNMLPSNSLLTQKDVLRYESALKEQLKSIISRSDARDDSSALNHIVNSVQDPVLATVAADLRARPAPAPVILSHLLGLVADLHKSGDLPALLFHFDRTGCETATEVLLEALEEAEAIWRKASPEWARTMQQWQTWKAQAKARQAQAEKMRKNKNVDDEDARETEDPTWQDSFDPNDPNEQFSFLNPKCSKGLIEEAINDIRWTSTPPWVLRALRRGIGLHHSGMNKHYRTTVESLYRLGHLRVVIATGTLALGINAPTKTSVFCSDSPFLTALMYRQCAGRAGRRGFDLLGKVVFYGLPVDRVQRLVLSKLPALGGNFPLTSTMVLRLFNLLHGSGQAPYAVKAVKSLLHLPQVGFTSETGRSELMHHIRFSIDYLRRASLLDRLGNPVNLFGLTNHLYYTEPSNFALAALIQSRVIHQLCSKNGFEDAKRGVLHLLCHLFGRRNVPRVYTAADNVKELLAKSASKVILPPLPSAAARVLQEKDDTTLDIFNGYAIAFARQSTLQPDVLLPLSGRAYTGNSSTNAFTDHLRETTVKVTARSSFVANSGHNDVFRSISDLIQNVRGGIHLKEHGVPSFHHLTSKTPHALNAYILDFYNHGQTGPLVTANGIRRGEIWYLLQDFMLTLKTFRASLAHMLVAAAHSVPEEPDVDVQAIDPAEFDDMELEVDETSETLVRPRGVSDDDWKVYEVVYALAEDFDAKFRKMWA